MPGTPDGTGFGFPPRDESGGDDPFADQPEAPEAAAPPEPETPAPEAPEPQAPAAPPEGTPAEPQAPEAPEQQPPTQPEAGAGEETPAGEEPPEPSQPQEPLLAGRFRTKEELEQAHLHLQAVLGRQGGQLGEAVKLLRQWAPIVEQARQQQAQPAPGDTPELDDETLRALQPELDRRTQQVRQEITAEVTQRLESERQIAEATASVEGFFGDHPDVAQGSPEDFAVRGFLDEFGYFPDRDTLELALEAVRIPPLYEMLRANPMLAETEAGIAVARRLAGDVGAQQPQPTPAPRAAGEETEAQRQARARAHVVRSRGPAPAPGKTDDDPWKAVMDLDASEHKSAFTGGS